VVFLVVFLAAFFFAMALVTSFQETNVRTAKLSVNDFFIPRAKIFPRAREEKVHRRGSLTRGAAESRFKNSSFSALCRFSSITIHRTQAV
jgi:hypothetical protein